MWRNISLRALDLSCFSMAATILRCVAMDDALRLSVCNDSSRLRLNISINPDTSFCSAWFRVARLMDKMQLGVRLDAGLAATYRL